MSVRMLCFASLVTALLSASTTGADENDMGSSPLVDEAVCVLVPLGESGVQGTIELKQRPDHVSVRGVVTGLKPGKHGFHIHTFGDLSSADGSSAGDHYNPEKQPHAGPGTRDRHAGDLGNIEANAQGKSNFELRADGVRLIQLLGRSLVVHQDPDDFKTQPGGNAGPRIAMGVIGRAPPLPLIAPPGPQAKLNINTASLSELQHLPGVDAATGTRLFVGRPYRSFDDLARDGVPLSTIEQLRGVVTFGQ